MSTSRRRFLKAGMLTALFAAVPVRDVLGQSWKDRDGNPGEVPGAQSDNLGNYSKATFKSYLNSVFQLHTVYGIVEVTLADVGDMSGSKSGECFSLLFRGGSRALRQGTYMLVHPSLGAFSLFLVPGGSDQNGAQEYVATINRLSYAEVLSNPAPARSSSVPSRTGGSPATPAPQPSPTPAVTPSETTVTPAVITPAQTPTPATTAPKSNRKPGRRKKPSWKNIDQRLG